VHIQAVEIVVEMDDGKRAVERIERPDVKYFDRETLPNGTRRVLFEVTGRTVEIGAKYGAHPR
jgi:hypothetical protein